MADAAEARTLVRAAVVSLRDDPAPFGFGALCHHQDTEAAATFFTLPDAVADTFDAVGDLRDQDDVASAGHAGVERDPARITAHHFADEHAVMGFGGGVEPI